MPSMMRSRRRARFTPRKNDVATRIRAAQLLLIGDPSYRSKRQRWNQFCQHCVKNGIRQDFAKHWDSMVGSWAASMIEQGMTYGSARTYVRNARSIMTGKTSPTAAIIKALSQLNALRPPSHAEDLTDLELIDIIKQLFAVGATRFAYTAFWMWNSPFRFEDLQWFRRKDFKVSIEGENYSVNVIRTKTVRDLVQGGTYTCPFHFMAAAPAEMIRNALDFVCHGERFTENIFEGEINSFNRALKAAHPRFENDGVPTSYSFRRSFMNRVVEHFRILGDGVVDWDAAAKFTLHSSGDVLRGHYERRISEEEAYQERRNAVALRAS